MIQQLEIIGTIYDLLALCSSYILSELKNESYEFELFNEDMYENVYNALNRYVCEEHERGERAAFDELKDFMYDYLNAGITIERCYAVVYYIDDLVKSRVHRGLYRELLDHEKNKEYSVLEIARLGRIGVAICKDLKNEYIKLFHKCIGTDILIVPACTNSMDLKSSAEEMAGEYNCAVLVANTCSARSSNGTDKRIGFISLPAKQKTDRTTLTIEYSQNECADHCKQACSSKLLVLKFKQTEQKDGKLSFSIKEVN